MANPEKNDFLDWKDIPELINDDSLEYKEGKGANQTHEQAFQDYRITGDQGHLAAQLMLAKAKMYEDGLGTSQSYEQAFYYYSLANRQAQLVVRLEVEDFIERFIQQSPEQAFSFAESIAQQQDPLAIYLLGKCFHKGIGTTQSIKKALNYYSLAAQEGYLLPFQKIAEDLIELGKEKREIVHCLVDWAREYEKKFPEEVLVCNQLIYSFDKKFGAMGLGKCYEKGLGTAKSLEKAINYYTIAYEEGDRSVCYHLGVCFEQVGSEEALRQAVYYYQIGCEQESSWGWDIDPSVYSLAICYLEGKGVERSIQKAKEGLITFLVNSDSKKPEMREAYEKLELLLEEEYQAIFPKGISLGAKFSLLAKAIKEEELARTCILFSENLNGLEDAYQQFVLGLYYHNCYPVSKSRKHAFELFKKAADQGLDVAQYALARYFQLGERFEESPQDAIKYYTLAANQGNAQSHYELGLYCEKEIEGLEFTQAFEHFQFAAEHGYPPAQYKAGLYYEKGINTEKSLEKAFSYYKLAADQNEEKAQFEVARCYKYGLGIERCFEKAIEYYEKCLAQGYETTSSIEAINTLNFFFKFERVKVRVSNNDRISLCALEKLNQHWHIQQVKAIEYTLTTHQILSQHVKNEDFLIFYQITANQGFASSQHHLGYCFEKGLGVEKSHEEAYKYFKLAADQGYAPSQHHLGLLFDNGFGIEQSHEQALKYYRLAADQGYAPSQHQLGIHFESDSLDKLFFLQPKALPYYQLAAAQGYAPSQYYLGTYFEKGRGVEQSYEEAIKYYELACEGGYADAQYRLGDIYLYGQLEKTKNISFALHYYNRAADQGHQDACKALFSCYDEGKEGIEQSYDKALPYLKILAESGDSFYQNNLGVYFDKGFGVGQSYTQAFKYFKLAADQGFPLSLFNLGIYFEEGRCVEQSYKQAFHYYKLAADQGHTRSQHNLGRFLEKGLGVKKSYEEAFKYYTLAAKQGYPKAQIQIGKWYQQGKLVEKSLSQACKYYKLAANQGNKDIQYEVAKLIDQMGYAIEGGWESAFHYYQLAAQQGHPKAIYQVFQAYHYGDYIEQSYKEAAKYLKLGENLGNAELQYELGQYYNKGLGNFPLSFLEALKYFKFAAEQGLHSAQSRLEIIYEVIHPHAQRVDISTYLQDPQPSCLKAILESYEKKPIFLEKPYFSKEEAQIICEAMIANPHFTVISLQGGLTTLSLTFELNGYDSKEILYKQCLTDSKSQPNLYGCVFIASEKDRNLFVPKNKFKYLSGSSKDPDSSYYVSPFYLREKIENIEDSQKTFELIKAMADQGNVEAQFYLSTFYLTGQGTEVSERLAFQYAKLAAAQGMPEAQYNLAVFYQNAIGTNKLQNEVNKYYYLAAEQSLAPAYHILAESYWKKDESLKYYQQAAEQNYIPSLISLGETYRREKNPEKALEYFQKALAQKNLDAFNERDHLEKQISFCHKDILVRNHCAYARKIHEKLSPQTVFYANAKEFDLDLHPKEKRLEILKEVFAELKDQPLQLSGSFLSYDEIIQIRDAMLHNPRITLACHRDNRHSLYEAFYRLGYSKDCLREEKIAEKKDHFGFLFIG